MPTKRTTTKQSMSKPFTYNLIQVLLRHGGRRRASPCQAGIPRARWLSHVDGSALLVFCLPDPPSTSRGERLTDLDCDG